MKARRQKHDELRSDFGCSPYPRRESHGTRSALLCVCIGIILFGLVSPAFAEDRDNSEYSVKLAFLYNFAQFVHWPSDAFQSSSAPLTICVVGENPFAGEIGQSLRGRAVENHPIELKSLSLQGDSSACQMIFVRAAETKAVARIFALSRGSNTLTVGEAPGFTARGGIINLTTEDNRLRFEINVDAAAQTRLKISSKLLSLAKIVKK